MIARRFEHDREIPEARFVAMMDEVLTSPLAPRIARLIEKRLGRKLEPFDLWYDGFRPRAKHPEAELDALMRKRYPTAQAYKNDIPRLLERLGFAPERAKFFAVAHRRRSGARRRPRACSRSGAATIRTCARASRPAA